MVYPDDRHVVERFMEPSQAVGESPSAMRIRCKDGREIWCESRNKNIYDSEGNPVAIEGIVRDVTERKRAEEALRESERHLRTVVGNAPVVLFATDQKGVYTLAEGKGLEALGRQLSEVVGRSVFEVYQHVPQITEYVRRSLSGEEVVGTVEVKGRIFETSYVPLWDTGGRRWLA
jgi:PAS domain S-box-containing protein